MVYKWKPSARIKADPERAAEVFRTLEENGGLTPARVVEVSRPKDAPLHNEFEWNDRKAADQFREFQARHLVSCLVVMDENAENQTPVRAYFPVTEPTKFTNIITVIENQEMKETLLKKAIRELIAVKKKYSALKELTGMFQELDRIISAQERTEGEKYGAGNNPDGQTDLF